jgi:hypothetical protein
VPDSSSSEDDKPVTKTFSMKTVTFAPQDSSEEEYDDPFTNDDPSEAGDASRSPPRLRTKDRQKSVVKYVGSRRNSEKNKRAKASTTEQEVQRAAGKNSGVKKGEECREAMSKSKGKLDVAPKNVKAPRSIPDGPPIASGSTQEFGEGLRSTAKGTSVARLSHSVSDSFLQVATQFLRLHTRV